jgi:hypothetical protein
MMVIGGRQAQDTLDLASFFQARQLLCQVRAALVRCADAHLGSQPEGGLLEADLVALLNVGEDVTAAATTEKRRELFPAGTLRIPTDQDLGTLAVLLLEPSSPDSFFQWGFFNSILSPTEYVEGYIMEPMAERMLAEDPKLAEEFRKKLEADAEFRASSRARLNWLYQKTPFYDERARLYPVGRETAQ